MMNIKFPKIQDSTLQFIKGVVATIVVLMLIKLIF
jgi:hypothetical protein